MTSRTPFYLNASGDFQRFAAGDVVPMQFGGVGPKLRGTVLVQSGNSQVPFGNATPLVTAGTQLWTATVTPTVIGSNINIRFAGITDTSRIQSNVTVSIFRGNVLIGLAVTGSTGYLGGSPATFSLEANDITTSLTPVVYSCRIGVDQGSTTWYFGRGASATFGGAQGFDWSISEEL